MPSIISNLTDTGTGNPAGPSGSVRLKKDEIEEMLKSGQPLPQTTPIHQIGSKPLLKPTEPDMAVPEERKGLSAKGGGDTTQEKPLPSISDSLNFGQRLYFNPDSNLVSTEETKFPLYVDNDNQFSLLPDDAEPAFAIQDSLFNVPEVSITSHSVQEASLLPALKETEKEPEKKPELAVEERGYPVMIQSNVPSNTGSWITQNGWFSRRLQGFNDFMYNLLSPNGQRETESFSTINQLTGEVEHIQVEANKAFTGDPNKVKNAEGLARWWWNVFTRPVSNQINQLRNTNPVVDLPFQAWSLAYDSARLAGTSLWKYTVGDAFDFKHDRKNELISRTLDQYAAISSTDEFEGATGIQKLGLALYAPINVMLLDYEYQAAEGGFSTEGVQNDYEFSSPAIGEFSSSLESPYNHGNRLAWKVMKSAENILKVFDDLREYNLSLEEAGATSEQSLVSTLFGSVSDPLGLERTYSSVLPVLEQEMQQNSNLAEEQETKYNQAFEEFGLGNVEEALDLMIESYTARLSRSDIESDAMAGTWIMAPDADRREEAFINALAQATLQKGDELTRYEKYEIMQRYVDPGTEFAYEMGADLTNLIPGVMMDEMMKGTKSGVKLLLSSQDEFLTKIAPTGWKLVKDFFYYNGLKAAGTKMKSRASRLISNLSRQVDSTDELAEILRRLGVSLRENQQRIQSLAPEGSDEFIQFTSLTRAQRAELGISDRVAGWADILDRSFVSFGEAGDDWGGFVDDAYREVYDRVLKLKVASGMTLEEATIAAEKYASKASNVAPVLGDTLEKLYLADKRIWKGGPLENSFSAWIARQAGKRIDNYMVREGLNTVSRVIGWMNQTWMKLVLTARPGFTVINYMDSVFRALLNGATPFQNFDAVLGKLDNEIVEAFMSNDVFLGTSVGRLMVEEGWRPNHVGELFMKGFRLSDAEGVKIGKLQIGESVGRVMDGLIAINAGTEFTWRARVFATEYERTMKVLRTLGSDILTEEYQRIFKAAGIADEMTDDVQKFVDAIWSYTKSPEEMKAVINEVVTGIPSGAPSPVLVPTTVLNKIYETMPRDQANEIIRKVTYAIRDSLDTSVADSDLAIRRAIEGVVQDIDSEINRILDNYKQLSFGDNFLNGTPGPPRTEAQVLSELDSLGSQVLRDEVISASIINKPSIQVVAEPMYEEIMKVPYRELPSEIQYIFRNTWMMSRNAIDSSSPGWLGAIKTEMSRLGVSLESSPGPGIIRYIDPITSKPVTIKQDEIYSMIEQVIGSKGGSNPQEYDVLMDAAKNMLYQVMESNSDIGAYTSALWKSTDTLMAYKNMVGGNITMTEAADIADAIQVKQTLSAVLGGGDLGEALNESSWLTEYIAEDLKTLLHSDNLLDEFERAQVKWGDYTGDQFLSIPSGKEFNLLEDDAPHELMLEWLNDRRPLDTIPEQFHDLYKFWGDALANEVIIQMDDKVASKLVKEMTIEAVKETADAGVTIAHNTELTLEILQELSRGNLTTTLDQITKTKLVNMPDPIANRMRTEIDNVLNMTDEQSSHFLDVLNRRIQEAGGNPAHTIDQSRLEKILDDILNGTEVLSENTGKEFMFYEVTRTILLERAGANFEEIGSLVDELVRLKLIGKLDEFSTPGALADFYEFNVAQGKAKYNIWQREVIDHAIDPKKITKRQYARESGEALSRAHAMFAEAIRKLGGGDPATIRKMIIEGGDDAIVDLLYMVQVEQNLSNMVSGPLHAWMLDIGPGPLRKTGDARAYAWNDFFQIRGDMSSTAAGEYLRVMSMTPEQRLVAAENREFISVFDFLKRSGIDLNFDANGNLIEIDFHHGRRIRYDPHLRDFERMFGLRGEEAFRAPYTLTEGGLSLADQVGEAIRFQDITFDEGELVRLNERFGVPDFEYNQSMGPGNKRYIIEMNDGSTKTLTSREIGTYYLDNDLFHETMFSEFGRAGLENIEMGDAAFREAHAAYLEEHPIEAYLRLWLAGNDNGYDLTRFKVEEMAYYMENTERGREIQDFTTWFLYHEYGDKVNLWKGKVTVERGVKPGKGLRAWDSMTTSRSVATSFHDSVTKWEIPIENVAVTHESFPVIDKIFSSEEEWILNSKGSEGATLIEINGHAPTAEDWEYLGMTPPAKEDIGISQVAQQIQAKWAGATNFRIEELGGSSLKHLYPNHADNPMELMEYLDNLIRVNKETGRQNLVDIYTYRRSQVESLYHQILKSEGLTDGIIVLPPTPRHLPPGRSTLLVNGEVTLRNLENAKIFVREWEQELLLQVGENPRLYPNLSSVDKDVFEEYGRFAADIRQQMEELAVYGSDIRGDLDDFVKMGLSEQYLSDAATQMESHLHPSFQGLNIQGALHRTNRSMLDYNHYSGFDELMMIPFPFWKFPSRSLPFWMETLVTKPQLTSFYMKYVRTSRRYAYASGATTTYGESLPSLTGYIPIPGTDLWFNPTAPFSFTYAMPDDNYNYDEYADTSMPMMREVAAYLYKNGTRFGLSPSPWLTFMAYETGLLSDADFPRWSIVPQTSLVPPYAHRWIEEAIRRRSLPKMASLYQRVFNPDVEWSDYLIERKLLAGALEKLTNGNMTEAEKIAYLNTVVLAVNFSTSVRANYSEDSAVNQISSLLVDLEYDGTMVDASELSQIQQDKIEKAREMWEQARRELESSQYYLDVFGYFSGMYGKEFTTADAELLAARDDINFLKWQLVSTLGWDVDSEALRKLYGGDYADDVEGLYDAYIDTRYNTDIGTITDLYLAMGWIDVSTIPPEGGIYDIDELKQLRKQAMAESISVDLVTEARYDATGVLSQWLTDSLATIPIGDTTTRSQIWKEYFERRAQIEVNPLYAEAQTEWHIGYKPQQLLEEHFRDLMWQMVKETMPEYDRENMTYNEWKAEVDQWKSSIPQMSDAIMSAFERNLFSYLGETKPDQDLSDIREVLYNELLQGGSAYDAWDASGDSALDAANKAWDAIYMQPYFDAVDGQSGTEYNIAVAEFYQEHPAPPTTDELIEWIMDNYEGQFTPDQLRASIDGTSIYTVEDKFYDASNGYYTQQEAVWSALSWIKPGQYYGDFIDKFLENGGNESDLDIWYTVGGNALAYKDPSDFLKFHDVLIQTISDMNIKEPTIAEMKIWVEAQTLNDRFKEKVAEELGDEFYADMAYFFSLNSSEKIEYKKSKPYISGAIDTYYDMKDEYASIHQVWAQFYHREAYTGDGGGVSNTGSNYYGSSGSNSGSSSWGGGWGASGSGVSSRDDSTPFTRPFVGVGRRSVLTPKYLLGQIGTARPASKPHWPINFVKDAGEALVSQVSAIEEGKIEYLSPAVEKVAIALIETKPEEYEKFLSPYLSAGGGGVNVLETQ